MAKEKAPVYTTPKGTARYPWLNKPNTKYKAEGEYQVTLVLDASDPAAKALMEQTAELAKGAYDRKVAEFKEKGKGKDAKAVVQKLPYTMVEDDDGNETGEVAFKFKMKAKVTSKKNGKTYEFKPSLFDSKGKQLPEDVAIYGGSVIKVAFSAFDYYVPGSKDCGVTLQIVGVQVIKLSTRSYEANAASCGFEEEEGYSYGEDDGDDGADGDDGEGEDTGEEGEDPNF